jgi:hypothetical protein
VQTGQDVMAGVNVAAQRFTLYPRPPEAPLQIPGDATREVPFVEQLAGQTVEGLPYAQMMFLRVAFQGNLDSEPTFMLIAGDGDPVTLTDKESPIHRAPGESGYVGDVWLDAREPDDVYRIFVGFDELTTERWRLLVRNTDPSNPFTFTAVVARQPMDTLQPWIDVTPATMRFDLLVGQTSTGRVEVANFGTVEFKVTGIEGLPSGLIVATPLPITIPPAGSVPVEVKLQAPTAPPAPNGAALVTCEVRIAPIDSEATNTTGHNHNLVVRTKTRTRWPHRGRLFFYRADTGRAMVGVLDADNEFEELKSFPPFSHGWKAIAGLIGGRLFFYMADGRGAIGPLGADNVFAQTMTFGQGAFIANCVAMGATSSTTCDTDSIRADDSVLLYRGVPDEDDVRGELLGIGSDEDPVVNGSFSDEDAPADWTAIAGLSGDRLLLYSSPTGCGRVILITPNLDTARLRDFPAGTFATDWTAIVGLSNDRLFYYSASTGRAMVGLVDANNDLDDVRFYPAGSFAKDWTAVAAV